MADFMSAMGILLTPYCLIMMVIGGFIGLILGAIPGLSGAMAITIILPLTFAMDSNVAIAMLIAIWVGSCSGRFHWFYPSGYSGNPEFSVYLL